jgi:hypothetical protein
MERKLFASQWLICYIDLTAVYYHQSLTGLESLVLHYRTLIYLNSDYSSCHGRSNQFFKLCGIGTGNNGLAEEFYCSTGVTSLSLLEIYHEKFART